MLYSERISIAESNYGSFVRGLESKSQELSLVYSQVPKHYFQKGSAFYTELLTREALKQTVNAANYYGLEKVIYIPQVQKTRIEFRNNQQAVNFPKYLDSLQSIQFMASTTRENVIHVTGNISFDLNINIMVGRTVLWGPCFEEFKEYRRDFFVSEIVRINSVVSQVLIDDESAFTVLTKS